MEQRRYELMSTFTVARTYEAKILPLSSRQVLKTMAGQLALALLLGGEIGTMHWAQVKPHGHQASNNEEGCHSSLIHSYDGNERVIIAERPERPP